MSAQSRGNFKRARIDDIDRATLNHAELKELAQSLGRPTASLYALSDWHDPFIADMPGRRAQAEWFASLWREKGFAPGIHGRRIHYLLVSTAIDSLPNGDPYENTDRCYGILISAICDARYLELIPCRAVIDRRNPEPKLFRVDDEDAPARIDTDTLFAGLHRSSIDFSGPSLSLPRLELRHPTITQPYHVEIWCEKSTMNDVLLPLGDQYQCNVVTAKGDMSVTACELLIARAIASGKPVRILYVSDFDPAGHTMPVSVARKIEFFSARSGLDLDIKVIPIVLTHDQCVQYRLPRTPIKQTDRRGSRFQERFGEGATELDALEALHPGELRRILEREITRYYDSTLEHRLRRATTQVSADLFMLTREVHERHAAAIASLEAERKAIDIEIEAMRERIAEMESALEERAQPVLDAIVADLEAEAPDVDDYEWPEPDDADEDDDPLFDSTRGYIEQIERYRQHQGKEAAPVLQRLRTFTLICVECGETFTASRPTAKICSQRCRTRQWRRLNPEHDQNAARKRKPVTARGHASAKGRAVTDDGAAP